MRLTETQRHSIKYTPSLARSAGVGDKGTLETE